MEMFSYEVLNFLFILARVIGVFILAPVFGNANFPANVKLVITMAITYILYPIIDIDIVYEIDTFANFALLLINELLFGLSISILMNMFMSLVNVAGALIDRNIGFAMVSVVSPLDESQIPVTANLMYIFMMLLFLVLDFHHLIIRTIVYSYEVIPVGYYFLNDAMYRVFIDVFSQAFIIGFVISAPFLVVVLIANIILGLLSKAMPGMNVFLIGMPFKIFVGFILFIILIPNLMEKLVDSIELMFNYIYYYLNSV